MKLRHLGLAGLLLLAGCASTHDSQLIGVRDTRQWEEARKKISQIDGWQIDGKLGYKAADQAGSGTLFWLQRQDYSDIRLAGPVGMGALHLVGKPGKVSLEVSGEGTFEAESPEALLQQQLGWQLPVSHLLWWVRGLPAPGSPMQGELGNLNRLEWLIQDGWQVNYSNYEQHDGYLLPGKLKLFGPQVTLTLVIKEWQPRELGK